MSVHDWYVENRSAYVARALEPEEERTYTDHVGRCDDCAREIAQLERDLAWLPMAFRPAAPRPGFTRWLAEGVLLRKPLWRRLEASMVAAAVVLVALGLAVQERTRRAEVETVLADREKRLTALRDTLSVIREAQRVIQTDIAMGGHRGGLLIFQEATTHRWNIVVHGLPPAPAGSVYQFWFITDHGMVRSIEFRLEDSRPAFATVAMPNASGPVMGAVLTVEPALSRSTEPTGPQVAHVEF